MFGRRHRRQGCSADLGCRSEHYAEERLDCGRPLRTAFQADWPQGRLRPRWQLGLGAQLDHVALRLRPHARLRLGDRRVLAAVHQRQVLHGRRRRLHAQGRRLRRLVLLEVQRPRSCRSAFGKLHRYRPGCFGRPADVGTAYDSSRGRGNNRC